GPNLLRPPIQEVCAGAAGGDSLGLVAGHGTPVGTIDDVALEVGVGVADQCRLGGVVGDVGRDVEDAVRGEQAGEPVDVRRARHATVAVPCLGPRVGEVD